MAIFERNETYTHWTTIRDRTDTKVDPTTVKITIYDPYNTILVNNQNMTKYSTGIYYYNYDTLSATALYGKYRVDVKATSGTSQVGIYITYFYVMPVKFEDSIRFKMGITQEDIDDDALSHIAWTSYQEALRDVYIPHYNEEPDRNPDTGVGFNDTNTVFQTRCYPIADSNGDGVIGDSSVSMPDITCFWIDNAGHRNTGYILVTEADNGEITITQSNGVTPIPSTNEGVYITYHSEYENFQEFLFYEAVSYLASHYVNLRLTERNKVTIADINADKSIVLLEPNRYLREYKRLIGFVHRPRLIGVR